MNQTNSVIFFYLNNSGHTIHGLSITELFGLTFACSEEIFFPERTTIDRRRTIFGLFFILAQSHE
jgi:hypothetical protein